MTSIIEKSSTSTHDLATMPHDKSEDFLYQMDRPKHMLAEVASREVLSEKRIHNGILYTQEVFTDDGTRYIVVSAEPDERATDIPLTMTTPWLTAPAGFNKRMLIGAMDIGVPGDLVSHDLNTGGHVRSLGAAAHNQLAISNTTAERFDRDTQKRIVDGTSRAAMIGGAVCAIASQYDIEIHSADLKVPCFPQKLELAKDLRHYRDLPINEANTLRALAQIPMRALIRYPKTLDTRKDSLQHNIAAAFMLTNGEAGLYADHMPEDIKAYILAWKGDIISQGLRWERRLAKYPNVTVDLRDGGGHLSCIMELPLKDWKGRLSSSIGQQPDSQVA